jgi:hypothetical protein
MLLFSYSNTVPFANNATELDKRLNDLTKKIAAVAFRMKGLFHPAMRAVATATNIFVATTDIKDQLIANIEDLKKEISNIQSFIDSGTLMKRSIYVLSLEDVDAASNEVTRVINNGATLMKEDPILFKQGYYNSLEVMFAFRELVLDFNKMVKRYCDLHHTTLALARTDFEFFKMPNDILSA